MGLSVWRETSKKLTVYRVCYTPIETLLPRENVKMPITLRVLEIASSMAVRDQQEVL